MEVDVSGKPAPEPPAVTGRPRPVSAVWRQRPAGVALLVVAGVVVSGWLGALDGVSLMNGAAAVTAEATGAALLVASWGRRERHWLARTLPVLLMSAALLVALIAYLLRVTGTVTDAYPPSFAVWVFAGFAAMFTCPPVLRHAGTGRTVLWRKAAAVAAVPLTVAGAFMLIDQEYGIWPQLGDVLGHSGALSGQQALHALAAAGTGTTGTGIGGGALPRGVIVNLDAPGTRSHFPHRRGVVLLPPGYYGAQRATLPVLVMLVGTPGTPINWLKAGRAQAIDDAYAAAHGGVAPVLVVVDQNGSFTGDTECVDGPQGNAETYLSVDVPAFITGTLHIVHDAARWGVVGYSEGGTCALDLVLGHPDVYRHAVDFGGDPRPNLGGPKRTLAALFGGSAVAQENHDPAYLLRTRRYPGVTVWFGAGVKDTVAITVGTQLAVATSKAGILTHRFIGIGGHNWQFASDGLARIFPQLCEDLGCTTSPIPTAALGPAGTSSGPSAAARSITVTRRHPSHQAKP